MFLFWNFTNIVTVIHTRSNYHDLIFRRCIAFLVLFRSNRSSNNTLLFWNLWCILFWYQNITMLFGIILINIFTLELTCITLSLSQWSVLFWAIKLWTAVLYWSLCFLNRIQSFMLVFIIQVIEIVDIENSDLFIQ